MNHDIVVNQHGEGTAWKTKPSWYIVATQDRTVRPDTQRFAANRMKATTTESRRQPCPYAVEPDVVPDVIRKAVSTLQRR